MKKWKNHLGILMPLLVVVGLAIWPILTESISNRESAFTMLKAVALASSLNILLGYTGYVSFGHMVFYGFGGYVGFYFLSEQGWNIWMSLLVGGLSSGILAFLLGKAILRLRGAYFALATIAINELIKAVINNSDLFGGPIGMTLNFEVYKANGGTAEALGMAFYIMSGIALFSVLISYLVRVSKLGLGLLAIRENEDTAEMMGVVALNVKTWAYILSAIIPGMVGMLFFFKNGSVEPHIAFPLRSSLELLLMVMLGGQGTILGPVFGAFAYQGMLGYLGINAFFKDIHLSVSGVLLLLIVLFIPEGAVGWVRNRFAALRRYMP